MEIAYKHIFFSLLLKRAKFVAIKEGCETYLLYQFRADRVFLEPAIHQFDDIVSVPCSFHQLDSRAEATNLSIH